MDAIMYLGDHPDGAGYYFADETWSSWQGPYTTFEEAKYGLVHYMQELEGLGEPKLFEEKLAQERINFWQKQFNEAKPGEVGQVITDTETIKIAWEESPETPVDRIPLTCVEDLNNLEGLIDGGYLSFIHGSREQNFGGWGTVRFKYKNFLILMDSSGIRQAEFPEYKSRRKERRDQYDYMAQTYDRVKQLRDIMLMDEMTYTAQIEGYEADDILALLFINGYGHDRVIAQDKDFFAVPGLQDCMTDHTGIPQSYRKFKLPKYAISPKSPGSYIITQAIFGDKSDSIPRLLPSRSGYKERYNALIKRAGSLEGAYWNCLSEFGDQFMINVRLVLLPHPTLSIREEEYQRWPSALINDLVSGYYWNAENYDQSLLQDIVDSVNSAYW